MVEWKGLAKPVSMSYGNHLAVWALRCGLYADLVQLCFANIAFFFFNRIKIWGNPASSKSISAIFPTAFALFLSLCHGFVILMMFQAFSLLLLLL